MTITRIDRLKQEGFPTVERLRQGVILSSIVHSFWLVARDPVFSMYWIDGTYFEDGMEGEHWAVAFGEGNAVAVFYSTESSRNPFPKGSPPYNQKPFFEGMPPSLEETKRRALSLMYDSDFCRSDPSAAVITAAIWAEGDRFTAAEPWGNIVGHSCWVFETHLLSPRDALADWWRGMGLPGNGEQVAWDLFERRIASNDPTIAMKLSEWDAFQAAAEGEPTPEDIECMAFLLEGVGIQLPSGIRSESPNRDQ